MKEAIFENINSFIEQDITSKGFPLVYKGELNHPIIKLFTSMADSKIRMQIGESVTSKRIYHVMIECLQNITKHSDEYDDVNNQIGNGLFILSKVENAFNVITGNRILNEKIPALRQRIENLNHSNKEELNEQFKKQMKEGRISEKGGAGLGLIDILRKTGIPLEYSFVDNDSESHMFFLKVTIPINHQQVNDF